MHRLRALRFTSILAVLLLACLSWPQQADAQTRIMPLGDSITGSPGCWRALLWNQLQNTGFTNIDFVGTLPPQGCGVPYDGDNEGHGGFLATNVANQNLLPGWLSATRPDIVIMHFGTNDVWSAFTPAQILAAFSTLVDQMRASNPNMKILVAQIIPVAPPSCADCPQRTIAFNAAIPAWAESKSTAASPIVVVDQWTGFNPATDTNDGVHPNDAGIVKIANKWYPALTQLLSSNGTNLAVSPTAILFGSGAANALLTVTSNASWTATDNASWLTLSPTAGSGNASITVAATANTATTSRSGTITVSGSGLQRMVSVTQSGTTQQQPPPAPAGLTAAAGNAQVSLSWSASAGATSYNVKRATTSGGPYANVATGVTATSFTNTGLINGTTYFYVVSAVNSNGESQNSAQASATPQTSGDAGGVTVTRNANLSPWYNEEQVLISNTGPITALTITIVIQRTSGVSFQGMWNTLGSQIQQSNSSTASAITYQFTLAAGQTLGAGTNRQFVVQASGTGTAHPGAGDTYTVTYTTGGVQRTQSGTFASNN
jgi:lysophospholipase L1-like esterase